MRICFITNLYPPHSRGGAERVVSEEARALKAMGHDVIVITAAPLPEDGDPGVRTSEEDGVRVHRFYPMNLFFYGEIGRHGSAARSLWHAWDMVNIHAARVVRRLLEEERPDVVHTHNLKGLGFGIPGMLRRLGIRHLHTVHDVQLAAPSGLIMKGKEHDMGLPPALAKAYAAAMRGRMGSPDVIVSPSKFLLRFYEDRGFFPDSEKVWLPNPAPEVDALPLHLPSPETRFLFLGQVEVHKGVVQLVGAARKLFKDVPNARLEVVGEGSAAEEAVKAAGKDLRVAFFGKKHPSKFGQMFSSVDFTVVPSLCYENAPTVVLESFAYGVPVIVADIGGAAELVRDGKNGFTFEAGKTSALVAVMKRAVASKKTWSDTSREARRSAELLSAPHHAERLLKLYEAKDLALSTRGLVMPVSHPAWRGR